jgi:hypothetical protein
MRAEDTSGFQPETRWKKMATTVIRDIYKKKQREDVKGLNLELRDARVRGQGGCTMKEISFNVDKSTRHSLREGMHLQAFARMVL